MEQNGQSEDKLKRAAVLGLAALCVDLAVKRGAWFCLSAGPVPLALGFRMELHVNPGVAFGLSRSLGWAVGLIGLAVLFVLTYVLWGSGRRLERGLALLWAGGLSNVLERLLLGGVTDFLFVPLPRLPLVPIPGLYVNLADLWLVLGAALLIGHLFFYAKGGGHEPPALEDDSDRDGTQSPIT